MNGRIQEKVTGARALQSETPPYLMKPNQDELADLLGKETLCIEDIKAAVQSPLFAGVEWVVVTLGELGAVVKHKETWILPIWNV